MGRGGVAMRTRKPDSCPMIYFTLSHITESSAASLIKSISSKKGGAEVKDCGGKEMIPQCRESWSLCEACEKWRIEIHSSRPRSLREQKAILAVRATWAPFLQVWKWILSCQSEINSRILAWNLDSFSKFWSQVAPMKNDTGCAGCENWFQLASPC